MAGLYIHIPFCKSRCIYCGFYSTVDLKLRQKYVDALCHEMFLRPAMEPIDTIYLGGGTPSQLSPEMLRQLFLYINKVYAPSSPLTPELEVTIEVNPDDVTVEFADELKQLSVNRVSMGAQTFNDERLRFLHRRHQAAQVTKAVQRLRDAGIHNISIDLMYGFPDESLDDWQRDIDAALSLDVEHISAYCLMIEEDTILFERMRNEENERMGKGEKGGMRECDEETERRMYYTLVDCLEAAGYEHYEISNFARPGFRSRHNSSYWKGVPYVGLGAAAHSFDGKGRQWNVADIRQYMVGVENGRLCFEREELDDDTRYNDAITVALRTREGINLDGLSPRHRQHFMNCAQPYLDNGLLRLQHHQVALTRDGLFVSDMVMSDLMLV